MIAAPSPDSVAPSHLSAAQTGDPAARAWSFQVERPGLEASERLFQVGRPDLEAPRRLFQIETPDLEASERLVRLARPDLEAPERLFQTANADWATDGARDSVPNTRA